MAIRRRKPKEQPVDSPDLVPVLRQQPPERLLPDGTIGVPANDNLLYERQREVNQLLAGSQRHTCLVGGSRSGKTSLLVRAVIIRAMRAKSRHAILRFRSNAVWPSIGMDTFPNVMRLFFPGVRYTENKTMHYFELENGSQIWLGGLDDKERTERILGNEYVTIYFNECSQIPYASVIIALSRLAQQVPGMVQRAYYDLNPSSTRHWTNILFGDKRDPVNNRPLSNPGNYLREFMNPADNKGLSPEYLESLDGMPERYRKRFRDGVYVDESDDALWKMSVLAACRRHSREVPHLSRVVVAIDPSGAKNEFDISHDEIGIMVVGLGDDGHAYVLSDRTLLAGPEGWARMAIAAYHAFKADAIVAEINYGGAMVEHTIRTVDQSIPFKMLTASRGKAVRAEPVSALYEQGKVHHVEKFEPGDLYGMEKEGFAKLEDELASFTVHGYQGARSPNRADALVWGVSEIMLSENASGFVEYYRRLAEGIVTPVGPINNLGDVLRAGSPLSPRDTLPAVPDDTVVFLTDPHRHFVLPGDDGRSVRVSSDESGFVRVTNPLHIRALANQGCVRQ